MNVQYAVFLAAVAVLVTRGVGEKIPIVEAAENPEITAQCKKSADYRLKAAVKDGSDIKGAESFANPCKIDCVITDTKTKKKTTVSGLLRDDFDKCDEGQGCLKGNCVEKNDIAVASCKSLYAGTDIIGEPYFIGAYNCKAKCAVKGMDTTKTCGYPNYKDDTPCNSQYTGYTCQNGNCVNTPPTPKR